MELKMFVNKEAEEKHRTRMQALFQEIARTENEILLRAYKRKVKEINDARPDWLVQKHSNEAVARRLRKE